MGTYFATILWAEDEAEAEAITANFGGMWNSHQRCGMLGLSARNHTRRTGILGNGRLRESASASF